MANIPNTTFRPIQVEETTEKNPSSENLMQGMGGDLNYLKNQADTLQAAITAYYASGAISITPLFLPAGTTTVPSPNAKQWFLVFLYPQFGGNIFAEARTAMQGVTTYFVTAGGVINGVGAPMSMSLSGSTLSVFNWAHEWVGFGIYQT